MESKWWYISIDLYSLFTFERERERERESAQVREGQREGDTEHRI